MAITRAQQARQLYQFGGGADMGGERGTETGREPGPVGGGRGIGGSGGNTNRERGIMRAIPQAATTAQIRSLSDPREKQDIFKQPSRFNPLALLPGYNLFKIIGGILPPGGKPFDANRFPGGGGDSQAMASAFIPAYIRAGFNTQEEYDEFLASQDKDKEQDESLRLAFRADGGPIGGEFDFESARQMYGLGKLVKKVTRTVKKIAKSPIGKAAIVGAGFGLAGMGPFRGLEKFGLAAKNFAANKLFGPAMDYGRGTGGILNFIKDNPMVSIFGASAIAGALTPKQELLAQQLAEEEGIDIEAARNSILAKAQGNVAGDLRATAFLAEGGKPEPVAKKTMPLLDMGGKEMDLREEGGFVPIGRMEKADDVPARLSKNEFVFTADAVRNAGDGDVDKGAEVMYNMMKNLEAGGEVSEESQGLEGARKMFQTSQRLEEVL
jgi:hypothetical protein